MNVVAVSGWGHPASALQEVLNHLPSDWRIESRTLDQFLAANGATGAIDVLVGWSAGGLAVLQAIARGEARPRSAVLLGATARFCLTDTCPCGVAPKELRAMRIGLRTQPRRVLERFFANCASPREFPSDLLRMKCRFAEENLGANVLYDGLVYLQDADVREALPKITTPTLLLHGRMDRVIPVECAEYLNARLPHATLSVLEDLGHALPEHAPDRAGREITQFLEELT